MPGSLERAREEIAQVRPQIVADVLNARKESAGDSGSPTPSISPRASKSKIPPATKPPPAQRSQLTFDVQSALNAIGYDAGFADGIYGAKTKAAIEAFQRDFYLSADGNVSETLLEALREASKKNRSTTPKVRPQAGSHAIKDRQKPYFTRGSHQDDILRLQGTPLNIDDYKSSGYEIWHYGRSTIEIDSRSRRVLTWDNDGDLKVRLMPGNQTTSEPYFTRGSHQDDVLRLQGTPLNIDDYKSSGYEIWHYGQSTIEINSRSRRVLTWDNDGDLKVRLMPGNQTTSTPYFTKGSHQDDVLRLQGTPSDIDEYISSGQEIWHYGNSTITIDANSRRVLSWDNLGNLKAKTRI
jgi:hypothetical protein